MFGKKCVLCGGKLDRNHKCVECGFDNSKSEKNYRLNQSSCDGMPLTHVHAEQRKDGQRTAEDHTARERKTPDKRRKTETVRPNDTYHRNQNKTQQKVSGKITAGVLAAAGILLTSVFTQFAERNDSFSVEDDQEYETEAEYDPYAYVTRELSDSGETYEQQFSQGEYVGGVHIPEGTYTVTGDGNSYLSVSVTDDENMISLYEWLDEENPVLEDIRIYDGAVVSLSGDAVVRFASENAQTHDMKSRANPLTQEVRLSDSDPRTAGVDFPSGVYDLEAVSGYGGVSLIVYDSQGEQTGGSSVWLYTDTDAERYYRNLVIPEGAVIQIDEYDEMELRMVPSPEIKDENYLEYYE